MRFGGQESHEMLLLHQAVSQSLVATLVDACRSARSVETAASATSGCGKWPSGRVSDLMQSTLFGHGLVVMVCLGFVGFYFGC